MATATATATGNPGQPGNQNSASILGTINGFLYDEFSNKKLKALFAGFGIGLSWGACLIDIDKIYAPKIQKWRK